MIGKPEVTIAGAGALGLAAALKLADAGCRVEVFDPAEPADNASGVAAGMLAPAFECLLDPVAADHLPLLLAARDLWPAFAARAGIALDRSGALWAGSTAQAQAHERTLRELGLRPEWLDRRDLASRAPGLAGDIEAGVYVDADWRLDAREAIAALRQAGEAAGVAFHQGPAPPDPRGRLVAATGAAQGLAQIAPELRRLAPIKGHILRFDVPAAPGPVVRGEGVYAASTAQGFVIGATMEAGAADRAVDPAKADALAAAGARLFPALAGAPFRAAAAVRAATPDGLPLVGFGVAPDVVLAAGARRNGWLLAPLVADVVVACILGDDPGELGRRFSPARFGAA